VSKGKSESGIGKGRGKSGGYRVITFFAGPDLPICLLTVFANKATAQENAV
jgi:mRNA-degrading endonuclease RelE of RelBE toxin-antitoxin system